jgi:peroxiredoxin/glutaredoxin
MARENREGQRVPEVTFRVRENEAWKTISTQDLFAGKNVVVFSLPGAFTPTCSASHVPRYDELAPVFRSLGVDAILCVSVNDTFVMNAWQKDQQAENVIFVPDGNGEFTEKMGMLVEKDDLGFGKRSWRYSMLVRDGVIEKQFIEPEVEGDPYEVSDADTMLRYLSKDAELPPDILLFTKANCDHCKRAKAALDAAGYAYEEVPASPRMLKAVSDTPSTPRVFVNGQLIGGAEELQAWLSSRG